MRRELGDRAEMASTLVSLGALLARVGRLDEATTHLSEAEEIAREVGAHGPLVLATCQRALLPDGDAAAATDALAAHEGRLGHGDRMQARFLLWRATSDPAQLAEAHRLLEFARDHAPEEYRETILENVPLHRDIVAAWEEHGAGE